MKILTKKTENKFFNQKWYRTVKFRIFGFKIFEITEPINFSEL